MSALDELRKLKQDLEYYRANSEILRGASTVSCDAFYYAGRSEAFRQSLSNLAAAILRIAENEAKGGAK